MDSALFRPATGLPTRPAARVVEEVVVMRAALCSLVVFFLAAPVSAQVEPQSCSRSLVAGRVDVETTTGTLRGTLFCLSVDEVTLLQDGALVRTPLSAVKRIATPPDPVWDGALKGASVVLAIWGVSCGFCGDHPSPMLRIVGGYALVGAALDALQTNSKTLYSGRARSAALGWRVTF